MKLMKETYVHNRLTFDETERDVLINAHKIISSVKQQNIHSSGAEDDFLSDRCTEILNGISELLDNYRNEYPEKN